MNIPSYQIRNVLNVYRKQLSQATGTAKPKPLAPNPPKERISISSDGQRQSIIDRISSEIVDRIANLDREAQSVSAPENHYSRPVAEREPNNEQKDSEFSYTVIDEHNRKVTNTLPIHELSLLSPLPGSADKLQIEDTFTLEKD